MEEKGCSKKSDKGNSSTLRWYVIVWSRCLRGVCWAAGSLANRHCGNTFRHCSLNTTAELRKAGREINMRWNETKVTLRWKGWKRIYKSLGMMRRARKLVSMTRTPLHCAFILNWIKKPKLKLTMLSGVCERNSTLPWVQGINWTILRRTVDAMLTRNGKNLAIRQLAEATNQVRNPSG